MTSDDLSREVHNPLSHVVSYADCAAKAGHLWVCGLKKLDGVIACHTAKSQDLLHSFVPDVIAWILKT